MTDPAEQTLTLLPLLGLSPGCVIAAKYRVDNVLGSGGMGVVLGATHLELDVTVAIKVMRPELAGNEEVVARMLFEARAAAKLRSAHVARVLDVGRLEGGAPYIVMERLEGRDLASALDELGAFPIQDSVDYILQVCEGLAEAHALGVVHRDLKPENLFLAATPEGSVLKVLDFGISKDVGNFFSRGPRSALTNAGSAVGSPYYMSPEQMRASLEVDSRADIWSLGCILFELLTGRCPFEGESLPAVCARVLGEQAPSLQRHANEAPDELDAIIRRCLEKDRNERFENVGELAAALKDFASAEGQRSADRSLRVASGINLKSGRTPQAAPTSYVEGAAGSASRRHEARPETQAPARVRPHDRQRQRSANRLLRTALGTLSAAALIAIGAASWGMRARAAAAPTPNAVAAPTPAPSIAVTSAVTVSADQGAPALTATARQPTTSLASAASSARATSRKAWTATLSRHAAPKAASGSVTVEADNEPETREQPAAAPSPSAAWVGSADLDRLGGRY
jgi:serine/threonine-protein kinase